MNDFPGRPLERCLNRQTFQTIHRYGAILSVLAILGAVVAIGVGDPLTPLIFPLGFFGPLCGFYFIGGVLEEFSAYRILGEELMRGAVWYGGSLLGWAFILSSSTVLPVTPVIVLRLPAFTALGLSLVMVWLRRATGLDLKIQTDAGQLLVAVTGAILDGFIVLYTMFVDGWSPLLVVVYIIATVAGLALWHRHWRQEPANL